ncbi:hypothetical protein Tco_0061188, partial [Tanacetum coccineum]
TEDGQIIGDVHAIRRELTEQRKVIDAMARDFSRFSTGQELPTCHILRSMYLIRDVESDRGLARPAPPIKPGRPHERISMNIGGEFTNLEDLEVLES